MVGAEPGSPGTRSGFRSCIEWWKCNISYAVVLAWRRKAPVNVSNVNAGSACNTPRHMAPKNPKGLSGSIIAVTVDAPNPFLFHTVRLGAERH